MECLTWISLSTEFSCFVAGEISQVIEVMPGSVVPLAMFKLSVHRSVGCLVTICSTVSVYRSWNDVFKKCVFFQGTSSKLCKFILWGKCFFFQKGDLKGVEESGAILRLWETGREAKGEGEACARSLASCKGGQHQQEQEQEEFRWKASGGEAASVLAKHGQSREAAAKESWWTAADGEAFRGST